MRHRELTGIGLIVVVVALAAQAQPPGGGPGFGSPGPRRPRPDGPPGDAGGPGPVGQIVSPLEADELEFTDKQRTSLEKLQKEVDARLKKLLTADQRKKLDDMRNRGPGRPGEGGGRPDGGASGGEHADLTSAHGIMHRVGEGPTALHAQIGQALESDPPNWDEIKPWVKEYRELAEALQKTSAKRGGKESWENLSGAFVTSAAELEQAISASDKSAATTAHGALSQSCMACHQAHRPMRGPGGPRGRRPAN